MAETPHLTLKNLTPHTVILRTGGNQQFFYSEGTARIIDTHHDPYFIQITPVQVIKERMVVGLPEEQEGVRYIVSYMVRIALPWRKDLVSPTQLVKNKMGDVVYCRGFISN